MASNLPAHIKRRERLEWAPGHFNWYWIADAPCGMEVRFAESSAKKQWATPDKVWCHHAGCDMCPAEDHTLQAHENDGTHNWFPVLACNSWLNPNKRGEQWVSDGKGGLIYKPYDVVCDGINHYLPPFGSNEEGCYWWYQGNYPNGWIYWQGDWRCGPCAEKTIIGPRS